MPWRPGRNGTHCRICKRHVSECGRVSARGKCDECRTLRRVAQNLDMHTHSGYYFDRWRRDVILSAGGIPPQALLDRIAAAEQASALAHE